MTNTDMVIIALGIVLSAPFIGYALKIRAKHKKK